MPDPLVDTPRGAVESLLRASRTGRCRRVVLARGTDHAQATAETLVSNARGSLVFLCGARRIEALDVGLLRGFLRDPSARVRILVAEPSEAPVRFPLRALAGHAVGDDPRLRVRTLGHAVPVHLWIADARDVRIGPAAEEEAATTAFNDPGLAAAALRRFEALWSDGLTLVPGDGGS